MRLFIAVCLIFLLNHSIVRANVNYSSAEDDEDDDCPNEIDYESILYPNAGQLSDKQNYNFVQDATDWIGEKFIGTTDLSKVQVIFAESMFESYTYSLNKMHEIISNPEFKPDRPTMIYIHGWLQNGDREISAMALRSAYRDNNDENVITIDWGYYAEIKFLETAYKGSIYHLKDICIELAKQLEKMRKNGFVGYESIYLVGHSLGGQCAGLVGRTLKKISNGEFELARIYALDPARPGFEANELPTGLFTLTLHLIRLGVKDFDCLSKTDAKYVQIIHTNGGELGMLEAQGHCDFFPNGGSVQRGCEEMSSTMMCNHQRSWIYFQESVRNDGAFRAVKCRSYKEFQKKACDYNNLAIMGYSNETLPVGKYYLKTHANQYHTGLGYDGLEDKLLNENRSDGVYVTELRTKGFRRL